MRSRSLKSDTDYEVALAEIDRLMEAKPGTPDGERLDALATLVEAYEAKHRPVNTQQSTFSIAITPTPALPHQGQGNRIWKKFRHFGPPHGSR